MGCVKISSWGWVKLRKIFIPIFVLTLLLMIPITQAQIKTNDSIKIEKIESDTRDIKDIVEKIFRSTDTKISIGATAYAIGDEALIHAKVFEGETSESVQDAFVDYQIFFPNRSCWILICTEKIFSRYSIFLASW